MESTRETRGQAIAEKGGIMQSGDSWLVPSASDQKKTYVVRLTAARPYCSCPDFDCLGGSGNFKCKHVIAVEIVRQHSLFPDGSETVTQTMTVTATVQRKTYTQDWPNYNRAQCVEKDRFQVLLSDLCRELKDPPQTLSASRNA